MQTVVLRRRDDSCGAGLGAVFVGEVIPAVVSVLPCGGTGRTNTLRASLRTPAGDEQPLALRACTGDAGDAGGGALHETLSFHGDRGACAACTIPVRTLGEHTVSVSVGGESGTASARDFSFSAAVPLGMRTRVTEGRADERGLALFVEAQLHNAALGESGGLCVGGIFPPVIVVESAALVAETASLAGPSGTETPVDGGHQSYTDIAIGADGTHRLVFRACVPLPAPRRVALGALDVRWRCAVQPDGTRAALQAGRLQTAPLVTSLSSGPVWAFMRIIGGSSGSDAPECQRPRGKAPPRVRRDAQVTVANGTGDALPDARLFFNGAETDALVPADAWSVPVGDIGPMSRASAAMAVLCADPPPRSESFFVGWAGGSVRVSVL